MGSRIEDALLEGLKELEVRNELVILRPRRDDHGLFVEYAGQRIYLHGEHLSEETEVHLGPPRP